MVMTTTSGGIWSKAVLFARQRPLSPASVRSYATNLTFNAKDMLRKYASRVLVINSLGKLLMLEYQHKNSKDALSDKGKYYTIPGGELKPGESFADCAIRELHEETGLPATNELRLLALRQAPQMQSSGDVLLVEEQYFSLFVDGKTALNTSRRTTNEQQNIRRELWATVNDIAKLEGRNLWPSTIREMLGAALNPEHSQLLHYKSTREQIGDVIINVAYDEPSPV